MGTLKKHARRLVRQKVRRPARAFLHRLTETWCPDCQKRVQPFHTCAPKSDFRKRRAQQARTETRRAKRKASAKTSARKPRERPVHDYEACRDEDCQCRECIAFRKGKGACELPHQG